MALAAALAAAASVRLVGVALLGRPRSPRAAAAEEAGMPARAAMIGLAVASGLVGLVPGAVLGLADPALQSLVSAGLSDRAGLLLVTPQVHAPGYSAVGIAMLLGLALSFVIWLVRLRAVAGHRVGPAWDCGFGAPPAWLPFGDPLTQYGAASFAQPLRRALGGALLYGRERVDMPEPGETMAARISSRVADPVDVLLFQPLGRLRKRLTVFADGLQFLTIRRTLSLMFWALVVFLGVVAVLEQL
jgi:hypothetical protein